MSSPAVSNSSFVAIDFETANECKDSACAVGIAVIENGVVARSFQRLIRPPTDHFSEWNFRTHGIHWHDVKQEDDFSTVWKDIQRTIGDASCFVAHNAGFDQQVLSECCEFYGIDPPGAEFLCTIEAASAIWTLDSYTLPRVCEFLRIPLKHHNAESDASASAHILLHAIGHGYDPTGTGSAGVAKWAAKHLSDEIMAMVSSLMEDGQIEHSEIRSAAKWMEKNSEAAFVWPGVELKRRLDDILRDEEISEHEINEFRDLCCALLGLRERKKTRRAARKKAGVLAVCFTGFGPRKAICKLRRKRRAIMSQRASPKALIIWCAGRALGPLSSSKRLRGA